MSRDYDDGTCHAVETDLNYVECQLEKIVEQLDCLTMVIVGVVGLEKMREIVKEKDSLVEILKEIRDDHPNQRLP